MLLAVLAAAAFLSMGSSASAAPQDGFTVVGGTCTGANFELVAKDPDKYIIAKQASKDRILAEIPLLCVNDLEMGSVIGISRFGREELNFCDDAGFRLPIEGNGDGISLVDTVLIGATERLPCCPNTLPYYYDLTAAGACCDAGNLGDNIRTVGSPFFGGAPAVVYCGGSPVINGLFAEGSADIPLRGVDGLGSAKKKEIDLASADFYRCGAPGRLGCVVNSASGLEIPPRPDPNFGEIWDVGVIAHADVKCTESGKSFAFSISGFADPVCSEGQVREFSDISAIGSGKDSCLNLGVADRQACETCFDMNVGSATAFIWTSIGCVDTSQEGIVVRLFQIGVGIMGGAGVLRIIQASFLLQSGDPQKIEEGKEMVTAAIIALVVLVASVTLLQFLGVNVLGIFAP